MNHTEELINTGITDLHSRVSSTSLYGLGIGVSCVVIAAFIIGYQMTGEISLYGISIAHEENIGLRFLYLMPFILAFWGQHSGAVIADQAEDLIQQQSNEFQLVNSNWKLKSQYDATHDSMTDLPNRIEFYSRLKEAILVADREDRKLVLMSLDLDKFKDVNEVYGNRCGDLLLGSIAERLQNLLADDELISRTGGDEFSILSGITSTDTGPDIAVRIISAFESSFLIEEKQIDIKGSIGIAYFPEHGHTAEELMQKAELAMHAAKQDTKGYVEYSGNLKADSSRRVMLLRDLKTAIEDDGLSLNYQPKIDLKTYRISAVEALLRWTHVEHGRVSPDEFIPLAEQSRQIKPLTLWVIKSAMKKVREWRNTDIEIGMSINISTRDLEDPRLPDMISSELQAFDLNPEIFTLEITESSIMQDPKQSLNVIRALSELGLHISIDDFGTGYSSLAYISRLSVNEIKIDRTFVMGMSERKQDATIVKATIDLAHNLGLVVTAEGIEDEQAMQQLADWGCDIGQGYYFSPPLPDEELAAWLQDASGNRQTGT